MINLKITDDEGRNADYELNGRAVVAIIIDPSEVLKEGIATEGDANTGVLLLGRGDPKQIIGSAATALGSMLNQITDDPIEQLYITVDVLEKFKNGLTHKGITTVHEERNITPIDD